MGRIGKGNAESNDRRFEIARDDFEVVRLIIHVAHGFTVGALPMTVDVRHFIRDALDITNDVQENTID